jgi:hypothetical protein
MRVDDGVDWGRGAVRWRLKGEEAEVEFEGWGGVRGRSDVCFRRCFDFDGVDVSGFGVGTTVEGMISKENELEAEADGAKDEEEEELLVEEKESSHVELAEEDEDFCRRFEERPLRFGFGVVEDCCHDQVDLRASSFKITQSSNI